MIDLDARLGARDSCSHHTVRIEGVRSFF